MKATSLWLGLLNGMLLLSGSANAQVIPDTTLHTTVSQTGNNFTITNGNRVGNNLFHSFTQFSVPTQGSVIFNNASDVQNIFSRVTGGQVSNIDGLIRANGAANLFLLNPSGILFGPNAQLNIGGSFIGTTASSINFADGAQFSAVNPSAAPLLTISTPIGLQFGQDSGPISVQNSGHRITVSALVSTFDPAQNPIGLRVNPGNTLALLGNGIDIVGGVLGAANGSIELGSVQSGNVGLNRTTQGWAFDYTNVKNLNDIRLTQRALLDGTGFGSSTIQLQAKNIDLSGSSFVATQNLGSLSEDKITVNATESLKITETSFLAGFALDTGLGADMSISTQKLLLQSGGQILSLTLKSGASGNLSIRASESVQVSGFSPLLFIPSVISVGSFGSGRGGDIRLSTRQLSVNGALQTFTFGTGNSGDLQIDASDSINVAGISPVTLVPSNVGSSTVSTGNAGNVTLTTARLTVNDGAAVGSLTLGAGNAGNLRVVALDSIEVRGAAPGGILTSSLGAYGILVDPQTRATYNLTTELSGNAGRVMLTTPQLRVSDGGNVAVRNDGTGDAGNLEINADRVILTNQGAITAATQFGNGGNLLLNVQNALIMRNNSKLSAAARAGGNGGNININAPLIVAVPKENSDIIANAVKGRGGNIEIATQGLFGLSYRNQLTTESDINASSQFGVSGTVQINTIGVNPTSGLVDLPVNVADPSQQITTGCAGRQGSRFVATGRGGVPQNPTQQIGSDRTWSDVRDLSGYRKPGKAIAQTPPSSEVLIEATSWHRNAKGKVELIAAHPNAHEQMPLTCAAVPRSYR
ncbi:MAG: filamentous hemagglutinin N-terminal domain-containing protein [Stigonema ocellatum SAG 48.90 = DSM 106950]|nr:filamentous hemagglutinin N-terminal domain-containing protein [Stigonema ocellatum SAG 48.90 = DSM 106950]